MGYLGLSVGGGHGRLGMLEMRIVGGEAMGLWEISIEGQRSQLWEPLSNKDGGRERPKEKLRVRGVWRGY